MINFEFDERAERDLVRHSLFLAESSEGAALRFLDDFEKAIRQVREFPRSGAPFPTAVQPQLRVLSFRRWRLFYEVDGEMLRVVRILGGAEDPRSNLR